MAGPAQRGSRGRGRSPRRASSAPVGRGGVHGRTWLRGHDPDAIRELDARLRRGTPRLLTRSTYRSLLTKGLAPDEAANLTAFLCGIPIADVHWSLRQVNQLLFLREMARGRPVRAPPTEARPGRTDHASTAIATARPSSRTAIGHQSKRRRSSSRRRFGTVGRAIAARRGHAWYHPPMRPVITFLTDFGPVGAGGLPRRDVPRSARTRTSSTSTTRCRATRSATAPARWSSRCRTCRSASTSRSSIPGVGTERLPVGLKVARGRHPDRPGQRPARSPRPRRSAGSSRRGRSRTADLMLPVDHARASTGATSSRRWPAHLAAGVPFEDVGPTVPIERPRPAAGHPADGRRTACSIPRSSHVLIFGNVTFAGTPADLEAAIGPLEPGRELVLEFPATMARPPIQERTVWERTFGRVPLGSSLLMSDSEGHLSLADNQGDAARRLGLALDRPVRIRPA